MSRVYDSLKGAVQDTLQRSKANFMPLARVKGNNASSLTNELEKLERLFVDEFSRLKAAVKEGETVVAGEARHDEQVAGSSKAKLAGREVQRRDKQEIVNKKDSNIKRLEQNLTAKIKDFESQLGNREEILAVRDAEIVISSHS